MDWRHLFITGVRLSGTRGTHWLLGMACSMVTGFRRMRSLALWQCGIRSGTAPIPPTDEVDLNESHRAVWWTNRPDHCDLLGLLQRMHPKVDGGLCPDTEMRDRHSTGYSEPTEL